MELFCKLNAAGTTIVQVTHSETNAGYGKRIIRLKDGWLERPIADRTVSYARMIATGESQSIS
jgi:ABC-type lipoprotein export system ATPase subunit